MQSVLQVAELPVTPGDAAARFHTQWLPQARVSIAGLEGEDRALLIVLPEAEHAHGEWRLAAARILAREAAPVRVNLVGCDDPAETQVFADYLGAAPGVTGQYLPVNVQFASASRSDSR